MKKIAIIGSPGSGKSTLAKLLEQKTSLPTYHLDSLFWSKNWEKPSKEKWIKLQKDLIKLPAWIIDGNYNSTLELRTSAADTIIFLDYPTYLCTYRVLKRMLINYRKSSPGLGDNSERINLKIIIFVLLFKRRNRDRILNLLDKESTKKVFILKNKNDLKEFIAEVNKVG